ncbi:MAG: DNA-3-methyladenine glycosylase [Candidatus Kapabacteria bacterium]|nr:DNA-3-methyladenine glycosylase [Candidatus Kapabacteria bacterium]MCS7169099.1 DNA-3-methyladenine glycosylase [Candidatus Kapabacteria bacterium]MDW7997813.1 DNA-3-methyladenine glycosylase [Bacteroidota bacterium]MDW8224936.1 DNA-3-methyladenine glycosylase [Bacteroidota bacterium]
MKPAGVFVPSPERALPCEFFQRETLKVARELLGTVLIKWESGIYCAARLVEVEAYLPEGDPANHAFRGKTKRNAPMFEAGGILYVYALYGRHRCANIVTEEAGRGAAVLLRAAEPLAGMEIFRRRRGDVADHALCRGPANLASAFGFDLSDNFRSVCTADLFVQAPSEPVPEELIAVSPRIGVGQGKELLLRLFVRTSACLSGSPRR